MVLKQMRMYILLKGSSSKMHQRGCFHFTDNTLQIIQKKCSNRERYPDSSKTLTRGASTYFYWTGSDIAAAGHDNIRKPVSFEVWENYCKYRDWT